MSQIIEVGTALIRIVNEKVVVLQPRTGILVEGYEVRQAHEEIGNALPGDYGVIIDREADYSMLPVAVFNVLNGIERLKAIAIVAHRPTSATISAIDKALSRKPLQVFSNLGDAEHWVSREMGLTLDKDDEG